MRWDEDFKGSECFICGDLTKQEGDIVLCGQCKADYDGYILMGCMNCGNSQIVLLTENLKPKLKWLKENGFAIKKSHHTYFVVYPFCPKCRKGGKRG